MKVTALGTQGWMPAQGRGGLCTAVETDGKLFVFELGTGITSLFKPELQKQIWDKYNEVHVIISHFHLDHIIGMSYLPALVGSKRIHFYSPGKLLGFDTKQVLETIFSAPYYSSPPERWTWLASIRELTEGVQSIAGVELKVKIQDHPGGSLGFVVDNKFAQITDTICSNETIDFVRGVDLLFHECWYLEEGEREDHSHLPGVIKISQEAGVPLTGLIHLNPTFAAEKYTTAIEKLGAEQSMKVVNDGEAFVVE